MSVAVGTRAWAHRRGGALTRREQLTLARQVGRHMRREAAERPRSRAALLWRMGMQLPLSHNALDSE